MFCRKCGYKIDDNSCFCPNCGNKISDVGEVSSFPTSNNQYFYRANDLSHPSPNSVRDQYQDSLDNTYPDTNHFNSYVQPPIKNTGSHKKIIIIIICSLLFATLIAGLVYFLTNKQDVKEQRAYDFLEAWVMNDAKLLKETVHPDMFVKFKEDMNNFSGQKGGKLLDVEAVSAVQDSYNTVKEIIKCQESNGYNVYNVTIDEMWCIHIRLSFTDGNGESNMEEYNLHIIETDNDWYVFYIEYNNAEKNGSYKTAYAEVIRDLEATYGSLTFDNYSSWCYLSKGVCYLQLLDFNNDGNEELIIAHAPQSADNIGDYIVEVWEYRNGQANKMLSAFPYQQGIEGEVVCTARIDNSYCLIIGSEFGGCMYYGYDGDHFAVLSTSSERPTSFETYVCLNFDLSGDEVENNIAVLQTSVETVKSVLNYE